MTRHFRVLLVAVSLIAFAAAAFAQQNYQWDFYVQAVTPGEAHWTSPEPVGMSYLRYYTRVDSHTLVETKVLQIWVPVGQEDRLDFGEAVGPIPPEGAVLYQEHVFYEDPGFTLAADLSITVDSGGYFHVDVTNLSASKPMRFTTDGTIKVKATPVVYGDTLGDGLLDAADVSGYAQALAGSLPFPGADPARFDLDVSGGIDSRDLVLILNFIAGNTPTAYINWDF